MKNGSCRERWKVAFGVAEGRLSRRSGLTSYIRQGISSATEQSTVLLGTQYLLLHRTDVRIF